MRKTYVLLVLTAFALLFYGCTKSESCTATPPSAEATQILAYASSEGMMVTSHPSGLYYEIIDQGAGATADANSRIFVTYVGKTLDGNVIDEKTVPEPTSMPLSQFIEGWRIGLPLIQEGGTIQLVIPSALAFGCAPYNTLPGNAILFFEIHLVGIE